MKRHKHRTPIWYSVGDSYKMVKLTLEDHSKNILHIKGMEDNYTIQLNPLVSISKDDSTDIEFESCNEAEYMSVYNYMNYYSSSGYEFYFDRIPILEACSIENNDFERSFVDDIHFIDEHDLSLSRFKYEIISNKFAEENEGIYINQGVTSFILKIEKERRENDIDDYYEDDEE